MKNNVTDNDTPAQPEEHGITLIKAYWSAALSVILLVTLIILPPPFPASGIFPIAVAWLTFLCWIPFLANLFIMRSKNKREETFGEHYGLSSLIIAFCFIIFLVGIFTGFIAVTV